MGTNGGLTYHVHGSEYSSPDYVSKMSDKYGDEFSPVREVLHCLCQTASYLLLIVVICCFGFVTGLEFLAYPLLIRKLTCSKGWDLIYQSLIPSAALFSNMLGSIVGGIVVDKVGRRPVFVVACFLTFITEVVSLVAVDTALFLAARALSSLFLGTLYITTLLYCVESVPAKHRLHSYLLHTLAQSTATTLLPVLLSPEGGTWLPIVSLLVLGVGGVVGLLYPEPHHSAQIREEGRHSKFSVLRLDNEDVLQVEPALGRYRDMFYTGGKVVATLLILLFFVGGAMTTAIFMTFPVLSDLGCSVAGVFPAPCMENQELTSTKQMVLSLGCSGAGAVLGYIFVQRYGRKNSFRGPAAFRVVCVVSMVLCGSHSFFLAQLAGVVLFSGIMDFTLDLYSLELFAVRSRGTAFGFLVGMKLLGIASFFLLEPLVLAYVSPDLKFSVITVIGTLVFGSALGLRKETFKMALNIEDATVDIGL